MPSQKHRSGDTPRPTPGQGEKMTSLNFEKALADLEGIVEKLEKGGLSLNDSLALFEKGVKLAKYLRGELEKAEKKVDILLKDVKGDTREEPFQAGDAGDDSKKEE